MSRQLKWNLPRNTWYFQFQSTFISIFANNSKYSFTLASYKNPSKLTQFPTKIQGGLITPPQGISLWNWSHSRNANPRTFTYKQGVLWEKIVLEKSQVVSCETIVSSTNLSTSWRVNQIPTPSPSVGGWRFARFDHASHIIRLPTPYLQVRATWPTIALPSYFLYRPGFDAAFL